MNETQAAATRFCARVIGPLMLIIGAIVIVRFNELTLLMPAILQDGPLAFVTGIFTLICGCVLVAAHHHWNSATAIVISLIGLLTLVRGVTLMLAPAYLTDLALQFVNAGPGVIAAGAMAILIGLWLSVVGWFAKPRAEV